MEKVAWPQVECMKPFIKKINENLIKNQHCLKKKKVKKKSKKKKAQQLEACTGRHNIFSITEHMLGVPYV